jgi:hypothetical protein
MCGVFEKVYAGVGEMIRNVYICDACAESVMRLVNEVRKDKMRKDKMMRLDQNEGTR